MKAELNNYRQSPRKVRLVANLVKGKGVIEAAEALQYVPKRASEPMAKLLASAVANAKQNNGMDASNLVVKDVRVDAGKMLKRTMPRARGSAYMIRKRTSHVTLELAEKAAKAKKVKTAKK